MNISLLARCHHNRINAWTIAQLFTPLKGSLDQVPALVARGNRPLQMTFEALNSRGLEQMIHVYEDLQKQATAKLPIAKNISDLGDLVAVYGSLINATLSMTCADYRKGAKKAKVYMGFDIGHGIPQKVTMTDGKGIDRDQANGLIKPGQTGVYDRGYQYYNHFDEWQAQERHFVCRIKAKFT